MYRQSGDRKNEECQMQIFTGLPVAPSRSHPFVDDNVRVLVLHKKDAD